MHARHKECKASTDEQAEERVAQARPPSGLRALPQARPDGLVLSALGCSRLGQLLRLVWYRGCVVRMQPCSMQLGSEGTWYACSLAVRVRVLVRRNNWNVSYLPLPTNVLPLTTYYLLLTAYRVVPQLLQRERPR